MKNIETPRLIASTFPSGRWVMTGQNGDILTSECSPEKSHEFSQKNDLSPSAGKLMLRFNWAMLEIPVEHKSETGDHLFTDRGNNFTFDREKVTDDEIRLTLAAAEHKFGKQLTLTGDDPIFTARMATLADDMGITVLNPELKNIITNHRVARTLKEPVPHVHVAKKISVWQKVAGFCF